MRQAPERVVKLALLDTGARGDTPEQTARRQVVIGLANSGRYAEVPEIAFPVYVHRNRHGDEKLKAIVRAMAAETGVEAFLRQQQAIIGRPDSRPGLGAIRCPTLVLVGEGDEATPPELAREIAAGIPGSRLVVDPRQRTPVDARTAGGGDAGAARMGAAVRQSTAAPTVLTKRRQAANSFPPRAGSNSRQMMEGPP